MAKENVTIKLTMEIDTEEIKPRNVATWLYQFVNRINYEYPVKSVTYKNTKVDITDPSQVRNLEGLKHGRDELVKQ